MFFYTIVKLGFGLHEVFSLGRCRVVATSGSGYLCFKLVATYLLLARGIGCFIVVIRLFSNSCSCLLGSSFGLTID